MKAKIAQGAEAILIREDGLLLKERVKKGYRLARLDELLRKRRTAHEAELLNAARRAGVCTPQVFDASGTTLRMMWVEGERVKEALRPDNCEEIGRKIGTSVGKMHTYDIIHGDLTTSNMIIRGNDICFIDFGLGFSSSKIEDKAVDLYLLYHAIESTHWQILDKIWRAILSGYRESFSQAEDVIKTLASIEKRGRYRER
ncbi:MAG: KEOPS complex kinase/ATPase Bud32 [Candidatus Aenigmatarchaeota archaeon]